jgi:hypothetical protein
LLETSGTLRQLWIDEEDAAWASPDGEAGVVLRTPTSPVGRNSFTWVRPDGVGLQIFAQPYHLISGVVGDVYSGIWWIETPQAALDQWQLWQYDPVTSRLALRLRATGELFKSSSSLVTTALTPILVGVQPEFTPETGAVNRATLILDSVDDAAQQLYMGVFRVTVDLPDGGEGNAAGTPQMLLAPETYRGPLAISPDRAKLAYFIFDAEHPSLTSGLIKPPNTIRILTLEGRGASTIRTVYASESRFEFLAPNLAWQGNERLIAARSRLAPGDTFGLDRFAVVQIQLPAIGQPAGDVTATSHLFPSRQQLRDFAACLDGRWTLTVASNEAGELELARWDASAPPEPLFVLPANMTHSFLCWEAPDSLLNGQ